MQRRSKKRHVLPDAVDHSLLRVGQPSRTASKNARGFPALHCSEAQGVAELRALAEEGRESFESRGSPSTPHRGCLKDFHNSERR